MKAIVVTGISSGLGKSFFKILSGSEAKVVGISRRFLPEQREAAREFPERIVLLTMDLSASWHKLDTMLLERALERLACPELVFISNAGTIHPISPVDRAEPESIRNAMAVNMLGPMLLTRVLSGHVGRTNGKLTVLNISSGAASRAIAGWSSYCSTKAGIRMFFDVLAEDNAGRSAVKVIHIDPGVLDTGMQEAIRMAGKSDMPAKDAFVRLATEGKLRNPDDVAHELVSKYLGQ